MPDVLGEGVSAAPNMVHSGREADAKGQGIHNCIGCLPGAGSILPGDDLAGPDRKVVPVAQAAHIDAINLHIPNKFQTKPEAGKAARMSRKSHGSLCGRLALAIGRAWDVSGRWEPSHQQHA